MKLKATFLVLLLCACTFGKTFGQADPGCGGMMFSKTAFSYQESGTLEVVIGNYSGGFKSGANLTAYDATFTVILPYVLKVSGEIDFSRCPFPLTIVSQMMNALGSTIITFTVPKGINKGVNGTISIPVTAYKADASILYASVRTDANLSYPPSGNLLYTNDQLSIPVFVNAALPVTLSSFKVTKENDLATLNWTSTSEKNSERFEIERSTDGKSWKQIGTVASLENSTEKADYDFIDAKPEQGINYYRLKMIDQDQTFAYSGIRNITLDPIELNIFPNPVANILNIRTGNWDKVRTIQLVNINGEAVYSTKGKAEKTVDVSNLTQGTYLVKIEHTDGAIVNRRIRVQR
ncbi:hypothetical protein DSL64_11395 [Dyadobacter luteus]|jgi:hypothetical protein|uniref:Secretion system C-terminal sorting domain-containing protein n=1 Tax=Dyadobacter luteus TaxID=2259619 RepID=A0A3D8YCM2_9BACT|nr:T9SS type A sorting domain-containing protein [Dyadobacter luteus]REA61566.1 hypothetical protein DSL64_11395 [Dyadobacter luteus]